MEVILYIYWFIEIRYHNIFIHHSKVDYLFS